jgi:hypothetical protein
VYLILSRLSTNAKIGSKNTVPPILKIAKACTLFAAYELTSSAQKGVSSANNTAVGMYTMYEKSIPSTRPESGGNISKVMQAKIDMKNNRDKR